MRLVKDSTALLLQLLSIGRKLGICNLPAESGPSNIYSALASLDFIVVSTFCPAIVLA